MKKAIFLDRDGTLNKEVHYLHKIEDFEWCDGALDALKKMQEMGYLLFVVSNQSGVARGMFNEEAIYELQSFMETQLREQGIEIQKFEYCVHHPEISGDCSCRKPNNGMLEKLIEEYQVDRGHSWMIGDQLRDLEAGLKSHLECAGVYANERSDRIALAGYPLYKNLWEFIEGSLRKAEAV